ncbi:hypothetical protein SynA1528_00788 [Synechococcus sp. A15-28]|nr:hypothetical protein SynA1528_00788 [Synechococcus sp. A15-28]
MYVLISLAVAGFVPPAADCAKTGAEPNNNELANNATEKKYFLMKLENVLHFSDEATVPARCSDRFLNWDILLRFSCKSKR